MSDPTLREIFGQVLQGGGSKTLEAESKQSFSHSVSEQITERVDALREERRRALEEFKSLTLA